MKITPKMVKNWVILNLLGAPGSHLGGPCGSWEPPESHLEPLGGPWVAAGRQLRGSWSPWEPPGRHSGAIRDPQRAPGGAREPPGGPGEVRT